MPLTEKGMTFMKLIIAVRNIIVTSAFLLAVSFMPSVGVHEAAAQSACGLAVDAAIAACEAANDALEGPIETLDDLEELLALLDLCADQLEDVIEHCSN